MDEQENGSGGRRNWRDFYRPSNRPAWLTTPVLVVVGIVIIVGLVFLGRFIHHSLSHQSPSGTTTTSTGTTNQTPQPTGQPAQSGSSSSSATGTANKPAATGQTGQLPNSGPGDVVAIFLASSFAGAGLHYIVRTRKNS